MLTRAERASEATALKAQGLNGKQIAERMGLSWSYVYSLLRDPSGDTERIRRQAYETPCIDCGAPTTGCNGRGAHERCAECHQRHRYDERRWTRDAIVLAIQDWAAEYGTQPSAKDWNATARRRAGYPPVEAGRWPATTVVQFVFGKWSDALRAAGFEPQRPTHRGPGGVPAEEKAEVLRLRRDGLSFAAIGERLGTSGSDICKKVKRWSVP